MGNLIVSQNSANSTKQINKLKKELQKINLDIERAQARERKLCTLESGMSQGLKIWGGVQYWVGIMCPPWSR